jgi:hypothetical protein
MNRPESEKTALGGRRGWLLEILLFLVLCIAVHIVVTITFKGTPTSDGQGLSLNDYDYKLRIVKSFWFGEIQTIYKPEAQIAAIENAYGIKVTEAMPLADTPTLLLLLLPFSIVAEFNFAIAYTLWMSISLVILFLALEKTQASFADKKRIFPFYLIVVCVFTFSFSMIHAIRMGQSSLLGAGLLILLALETIDAKDSRRLLRRCPVYMMIVLLSVKIHYLIPALGILLFYGYFHEAVVSTLIVASTIVLLGFWKGFALLSDWINQVGFFSGTTALPSYYVSAFSLHTLITLRSAFSQFTNSPIVGSISYFIIVTGGSAILFVSLWKSLHSSSCPQPATSITPQRSVTILFGLLLLFLPYLGGYEDLLLLVPYVFLFATAGDRASIPSLDKKLVLAVFCTGLVLNYNLFPPPQIILLFWLMKALALACLFLLLS